MVREFGPERAFPVRPDGVGEDRRAEDGGAEAGGEQGRSGARPLPGEDPTEEEACDEGREDDRGELPRPDSQPHEESRHDGGGDRDVGARCPSLPASKPNEGAEEGREISVDLRHERGREKQEERVHRDDGEDERRPTRRDGGEVQDRGESEEQRQGEEERQDPEVRMGEAPERDPGSGDENLPDEGRGNRGVDANRAALREALGGAGVLPVVRDWEVAPRADEDDGQEEEQDRAGQAPGGGARP